MWLEKVSRYLLVLNTFNKIVYRPGPSLAGGQGGRSPPYFLRAIRGKNFFHEISKNFISKNFFRPPTFKILTRALGIRTVSFVLIISSIIPLGFTIAQQRWYISVIKSLSWKKYHTNFFNKSPTNLSIYGSVGLRFKIQ